MKNNIKVLIFVSFFILILFNVCYAIDVVKYDYEEFYRYHEFLRSDGKGWLATSEYLASAEVKTYEQDTGTETSTAMISDVSIVDGNDTSTRVKYKLKAGTVGTKYYIKIKTVSSTGQKFEDVLELEVF